MAAGALHPACRHLGGEYRFAKASKKSSYLVEQFVRTEDRQPALCEWFVAFNAHGSDLAGPSGVMPSSSLATGI